MIINCNISVTLAMRDICKRYVYNVCSYTDDGALIRICYYLQCGYADDCITRVSK